MLHITRATKTRMVTFLYLGKNSEDRTEGSLLRHWAQIILYSSFYNVFPSFLSFVLVFHLFLAMSKAHWCLF